MGSFRRLLSVRTTLVVIALFLAACSSGDGDDPAAAGDSGAETVDTQAPITVPPIDTESPVDPATVSQLSSALLQSVVEGEDLTCLVDDADGDTQLTALYNGFPDQEITPESFTALTVSMHGCFNSEVLATSLVALSGSTDPAEIVEYTSCVSSSIDAEPNGDLAYTGLAALLTGSGVPEGAQQTTLDVASSCIPAESVIEQIASGREQFSNFQDEVDRQCVLDELDDTAMQDLWQALIEGIETAEATDALLDPCTDTFDSGLPTEVPASFTPWAGEGVLAGIDPFSRADAYDAPPPNQLVDGVDYQAVITTTDGEIVIDLFEETAPITVNSFVSLARDGFYDGTVFHRVLDGFMAQGGDPTATGSGGPGFSFDDEQSALTSIDRRGLIAMANSGPNTNGSQFFITFEPATFLDGLHAVFGEVIEGDDVLGQIDLRDPDLPTSRGESLIGIEITEN